MVKILVVFFRVGWVQVKFPFITLVIYWQYVS